MYVSKGGGEKEIISTIEISIDPNRYTIPRRFALPVLCLVSLYLFLFLFALKRKKNFFRFEAAVVRIFLFCFVFHRDLRIIFFWGGGGGSQKSVKERSSGT